MNSIIKIIIGGLDEAGKTSILTALDKKYDFQQEVLELKPTFKIEYHKTIFLKQIVTFFDMGGQEKFRKQYQNRADLYFGETDLLVYIIDIQNSDRYNTALDYLDTVLGYFINTGQDVPLIVSFHKFDPDIRGNEEINENIEMLKENIAQKYPDFKILFQQTSIYDIVSIVQLISYGLSVFDEKFFELSDLLERYIDILKCSSLILFDENGIIVSEFYSDNITPELYVGLLEEIKEHLYLLKRMQEERYNGKQDFIDAQGGFLSYLQRLEVKDIVYYISAIVKESLKDGLLDKFTEFRDRLTCILEEIMD